MLEPCKIEGNRGESQAAKLSTAKAKSKKEMDLLNEQNQK